LSRFQQKATIAADVDIIRDIGILFVLARARARDRSLGLRELRRLRSASN